MPPMKPRYKYLMLFIALLVGGLLVVTPLSTETMVINSKLKRISRLSLGLNRIIAFQDNPHLPIKQNEPEQFRIVHIGDSHIQAGFLTGEVRKLLANYLDDSLSSVGYAFPYNLAGTNSPAEFSFKSEENWIFTKITIAGTPIGAGLSGMVMETSDLNPSLFISTKNLKYGHKYFDEITVFVNAGNNCITIDVDGLESKVESFSVNHIKVKLAEPVAEANILFRCNGEIPNRIVVSGVMLVNSASKIVYHSAGLNGADVKSYLRAAEFENQIKQIDPQLIIVSLGTNDAYHPLFKADEFSALLDSLITRIKRAIPSATVLLTIPGDHMVSRINSNPKLVEVKNAIVNSAIENKCCVWDFHSVMGGEGSVRIWNSMGLTAPDLLHLNAKGYQLQGELLFDALTCEDEFLLNQ